MKKGEIGLKISWMLHNFWGKYMKQNRKLSFTLCKVNLNFQILFKP